MNSHPLVLNDWFSVDKAASSSIKDEWIMVKVPGKLPVTGWKEYMVTWIKDTTRASLADAIAPRILFYTSVGGWIPCNWLTALVIRQYLLPYLF